MLQDMKQKIWNSGILRDERFVAALVIFTLIVPIPYEGHTTIVESKSGELKVDRDYYTTTIGEMIYGIATASYEEVMTEDSIDERLLTGEDCDVPEKFSISFGDLEYYPGNETARIEIESTENVNSTYLERVSLRGFEGNGTEKSPVIRSGNRTSRTGLIATDKDAKNAVGKLPLQPMNITVLGLTENKSDENFSGLDSGDQIQLRYRQQYVAVKNFCHRNHDIALFKLKEDKPEIDWKAWPPYTEGHLWKYDNISDEDLKEMTREEKEELAYDQ